MSKLATGKEQSFSQYLMANMDNIKKQVANALPKHLNAEKMLRVLMTELKRVQNLNKCTTQSILSALIQSSQLGLEPGGVLGHSYLIPFFNSKLKMYECQFIVGYRGMIDLARRSGQLISISAHDVYEGDIFEVEFGLNEKLKHVPVWNVERGEFKCAYAIAKLANTYDSKGNDSYQFEVMPKAKIDKIKARSKSAGSEYSPWVTDYEEMAKKTVIRNLFKYLPVSVELAKAIAIDEANERGETSLDIDLIDDADLIIETPSKADAIASKLDKTQGNDEWVNAYDGSATNA